MDSVWNAYVTWWEDTVKCTVRISAHKSAQSFVLFNQIFKCSFTNQVVVGSSPVGITLTSDIAPVSSKEVLEIPANIECGFTLKLVRDIIKTCSQMDHTDKHSQLRSINWSVWPNGWVFVYELSGCGFDSRWSHLNLRCGACFEQQVPWNSGKQRTWIHSETRWWHHKNIQSNAPYR